MFFFCCVRARGEITDPFDNTLYLTAALNSQVTADGTARMTITGTGDSVVNWRQSYYVRLRNYNDRVEVDPVAAIGSGQYSLYVLLFNSAKQFLTEIQWAQAGGDCTTRILESVSRLAAAHQVQNVEYYWIRFRLHGAISEGFEFDEIRVLNGPGYWPPTALTQAAPKAVLGHVMTGFRTPLYSGSWAGWNYSNAYVSHNPFVLDPNGRPDIASVCYPSVGYYDMNDPKLIEYHCQCLKMACMDGVIFDLGFYAMDPDTVSMVTGYLNTLSAYGLKAVICYEDKAHWIWDSGAATRAMALQRAYEDMDNWLSLFLAGGTQYYVTGQRPLFLLFSYEDTHPQKGITCLLPDEIEDWLDTFDPSQKPVLMRQWFKDPDHAGILNGQYGWPVLFTAPPEMAPYVGYCSLEQNQDQLYTVREYGQYLLSEGLGDFHMPGVWPGFDDLAIWGWGSGPRLMPRYNGDLYQQTWQWAIEDDLPVIQVATWNDWFEATIIEPSVEYGGTYLEITSLNAATFKEINDWNIPDVNVPVWIYRIRDITADPCVLEDLNTASDCIRTGQFAQARMLVRPWADYFQVDSIQYWTGPGSIQTSPEIQVPLSCDAGTVYYGDGAEILIEVRNTGTQPLEFTGNPPVEIIVGGEDFSISPPFSVQDLYVNQSRNLSVLFSPPSSGSKSCILQITTNDPSFPTVYVTIEGQCIFKPGDFNEDGDVNLGDLVWLSQCWLDTCGIEELALAAEYWLD